MFLSRLRAGSDDRSPWGNFWFSPVSRAGGAGVRVTPDSALSLPVVFACVRVLSESFGVLPMRMYQRNGNGRTRIAKHWLLDLIGRRPNAYQTPYEWKTMVQSHLVLRGNAYNRIITNRAGDITDLLPMHPDRVKVEMLGDYDYRYIYTDRLGAQTTLTRADVWHLRGLSSDGIVGMSMIELAREAVGMGLAAQEFGARFFANDAKPGLWIEFPGTFKDKAARDQFKDSFQSAQTGMSRHKMAVLEAGMKIHELSVTNKDSQFLEARQFQVADIARMFRVPPHMVGDLSKASFSNIEQQSLDFIMHTMTPWATLWESSQAANLLLEEDHDKGIEIEYDFAALLRGDQVARASYYHNGVLDGWLTRNEAREREGLEPIDGLDDPLRPLNMVPESEAQDEAAAAKAAPPSPAVPAQPVPDPQKAALLAGNASRMARRIAAGNAPTVETLADALAIPAQQAAAWLAVASGTEDEIKQSLIEVAST